MMLEEYINVMSKGGLVVEKIEDYYFSHRRFINYSIPTLISIPIDSKLIELLRWKYLISVILTDKKIKNTYEYVLQTENYNLEVFNRKVKNRIRKSLKNCTFKRPSLNDLLKYGLTINQNTCIRQYRHERCITNFERWKKYAISLNSNEKIIILGAYYNDRMVGYISVCEINGNHIILQAYIDRNDSETTSPMNGLLFTLVNDLIRKNGTVRISYGIESFLPLPGLDKFKSNMLFERIPVSRVYLINPLILPFIKLIIFYNIQLLRRKKIRNQFIRNIIRLYQGHRLLFKEKKKNSNE